MKKLVFYMLCLLCSKLVVAQTPFPCYNIINNPAISYSQNTGVKEYKVNCLEVSSSPIPAYGSIVLENDAQTTMRANKSIHLKEGFQSKNYSSSGFAHFTLGAAAIEPFIMNLGSPVVGKHKKIEIGFRMPEEIETQVFNYLYSPSNYLGMNPYDPNKINIVAEFRNSVNSNVNTRYGFYYEYYEKEQTPLVFGLDINNIPYTQSGNIKKIENNANMLKWRVRFAPDEVGYWYGKISIYIDGVFLTEIVGINFECVPSNEHGYLEIGAHHRQFRFHDDNKSFYAIGQNLTWPTTLKYVNYSAVITNDSNQSYQVGNGTEEWLHTFRNLGDNGGNFARTVFYQGDNMNSADGYDGGQEIEWEKLGDYQSRQHCMFVLDEVFDIAEQKGIFIMLTPNIQNEFADKWDFNPYRTNSAKNSINPLKPLDIYGPWDFLTNTTAIEIYKRKLRYIHSRWGYGPHLAAYELVSEMNNWQAWTAYTDKLFAWQFMMFNYYKNELNAKQLISSSYYGSQTYHESTYSSPFLFLDFTSQHDYQNKKHASIVRLGNRNNMLNHWDKPTNFGEMGMQKNPADNNDWQRCDPTEWHNALWATAFMEGYGAGLNWYANDIDAYRASNFPAMKQFFSNVEFELDEWTTNQHWSNHPLETNLDDEYKATIEVFAMTTNSSHKAMGWVHQATNWWGNKIVGCKDRNNYVMSISIDDGDDDDYNAPLFDISNFQLTGLIPFTQYQVDFYRTDDGGGQWYSSEFKTSNILGQLHPSYPPGPTNPDASGYFYDYAFKASKSGVTFRNGNYTNSNTTQAIDTLTCNCKSVKVNYVWFNDSLGLNKYEWTWANKKSIEQFPEITFTGSGNYNLVLKITFPDGKTESFNQILIIPDCSSNLSKFDTLKVYKSNDFLIFPNPTYNFLTIELKESTNYICTIIDTYGKKIKEVKINGKSFEIDCKDLSVGLYFIKVENQNTNYISKFIKQ